MQPLPAVQGCDLADVRFLDAIDSAYSCLDEAQKLFECGMRLAGMEKLGEAVRFLEAVE